MQTRQAPLRLTQPARIISSLVSGLTVQLCSSTCLLLTGKGSPSIHSGSARSVGALLHEGPVEPYHLHRFGRVLDGRESGLSLGRRHPLHQRPTGKCVLPVRNPLSEVEFIGPRCSMAAPARGRFSIAGGAEQGLDDTFTSGRTRWKRLVWFGRGRRGSCRGARAGYQRPRSHASQYQKRLGPHAGQS